MLFLNFPAEVLANSKEVYFPTFNRVHSRMHVFYHFVQIRSSFWSVFSCTRAEYGDLLSIQTEYGKTRTRKSSVFGHFSRSAKGF